MSDKTEEQIQAGIDAAVAKMGEGLADYFAALATTELGESATQAFVIFESQGMNADGQIYYRPGSLVIEQQGSPHTAVGLLTVQASVLAERIMSAFHNPDCDHEH